MKATFNISRVGLLLQRYFILRKRWERIYWSIIIFLFMFVSSDDFLLTVLIIISGMFYIAMLPKEMHDKTNGISYLMTPASRFEKFITLFVIGVIYCFIMLLVTYCIGNVLGHLFYNLIAPTIGKEIAPLTWELFNPTGHMWGLSYSISINIEDTPYILMTVFLLFLQNQVVFLLGGLYFKRNALAKTILCCIAFFVFYMLTMSGIVYWGFVPKVESGTIVVEAENIMKDVPLTNRLLSYLGAPILLFIGYVRFTEKQI